MIRKHTSKNSKILSKSPGSNLGLSPIGNTLKPLLVAKAFNFKRFFIFFAYVIQSTKDPAYYYKGHRENLEKRLAQHKSGMTKSIKNNTPFTLVYSEAFEKIEDAVLREKYFKTATERRFLKMIWHLRSILVCL